LGGDVQFIAAIAKRSDSGFHEVMLRIVFVDQTQKDSGVE
jgi:hypothetical protein